MKILYVSELSCALLFSFVLVLPISEAVLQCRCEPGPPGPPGPPGEPGRTGPQGPDGRRGPSGSRGLPGFKGGKGNAGSGEGPKGDPGTPGQKGTKGDLGPPGATGPAGPRGPVGSDGRDGTPGTDGATGAKGDKGQKGEVGLQGNTGDKGDTGDTGEKGEKGDNGDKGEKGEKGDQGDTGDAGADGTDGTNCECTPRGLPIYGNIPPFTTTQGFSPALQGYPFPYEDNAFQHQIPLTFRPQIKDVITDDISKFSRPPTREKVKPTSMASATAISNQISLEDIYNIQIAVAEIRKNFEDLQSSRRRPNIRRNGKR